MEKNINRNVGLDVLRDGMCFGVILIHFWLPDSTTNDYLKYCIVQTQQLAVPVFMLVSFIVVSKPELGFDMPLDRFKKRLNRLCLPILIWAIVYAFVFLIAQLVLNKEYNITPYAFIRQIFIGHEYNKPMWFQNTLFYFTCIFFVLYKLYDNVKRFALSILICVPFILQYTGYNHVLLDGLPENVSIPCGRFINMLPYACFGILLVQSGILGRYKDSRYRNHVIIVMLLVFALVTTLITPWSQDTFGSCGFRLLVMTVSLVCVGYLLPMEKMKTWIYSAIQFLSKYCLGVYCIHNMVGGFYNQIIVSRFNLAQGSVTECIIIFALSISLCWLISYIPIKTIKKIVS